MLKPDAAKPKVALLFGSFNPLHEGHLAILRYLAEHRLADELRLVVSPQSPFKQGQGLLDNAHERLDAARAAVAQTGLPVAVSDVEFDLPEPRYTIDTLRHLARTEPGREFVLVMGGDNITSLENWHLADELLQEFEVWVYPRPGTDAQPYVDAFNARPGVKGVKLFKDAPQHNISSTEIRARKVLQYDVIIIGGGITGVGLARDCALRGLKAVLVERDDLTVGASGRNHGLLHSGARYAMGDSESARECIAENRILKQIAPHCIDACDGLFVTLPEDDLGYQQRFIDACLAAGIDAAAIDPAEARRIEPSVNPELVGAVLIPDASVDPFRLVFANALDAAARGAEILSYHEVRGLRRDGRRVTGIDVWDVRGKQEKHLEAPVVVNAAGTWAGQVAAMAGARITMYPDKGTLLVFGTRINQLVLNRCRPSSDADILVPSDVTTILGTTSQRLEPKEIPGARPTPEEVDLLLSEGSKLAPALMQTRILRAYSGIRPLIALDGAEEGGRHISRSFVLFDHESRDDVPGLVTIAGGKMMTYRLMAERTVDLVCRKLGRELACTTAEVPLPEAIARPERFSGRVICECENVREDEIRYAIDQLGARTLLDLRRRTRVGMGSCQGQLCALRAAQMLPEPDVRGFINERWKGIYPVAWGEAMREAQLAQWMYKTYQDKSL